MTTPRHHRAIPLATGRGRVPAKPAPKKEPKPRTVIDWDAVAEVLSRPVDVPPPKMPPVRRRTGDGATLPTTGYCHECGRAVSGERRFCGPCLANRGTV